MPNKDDLMELIESVNQEDLSRLLVSFFGDKNFMSKFEEAPASTRYHGDHEGGLLDHTVGVAKLCGAAVAHHGGIDRDLLITGAILHDIGKMDCYYYTLAGVEATKIYRTTVQGRLLGHITIGVVRIHDKFEKMEHFCDALAGGLQHMILSHHGPVENGWGSAVDPVTPEAIALHYADLMESRVAGAVQHG